MAHAPLLAFKICFAVISAVPFLMDTVRDWLLAHDAIIQWEDSDCGVKSAAVQHTQRKDRESETGKEGNVGKTTMKNLQINSVSLSFIYMHHIWYNQDRM